MYRVALLYPAVEGASFDHEYYVEKHMPLVAERLGDVCQSWSADKVIKGDYFAIGYLVVTDMQAFGSVMEASRPDLTRDIANCTSVAPQVVAGEILAD